MNKNKPCTTAIERRLLTFAGVIDKDELPEVIQEMPDQRQDCADHLGKVFAIEGGKSSFHLTFLSI